MFSLQKAMDSILNFWGQKSEMGFTGPKAEDVFFSAKGSISVFLTLSFPTSKGFSHSLICDHIFQSQKYNVCFFSFSSFPSFLLSHFLKQNVTLLWFSSLFLLSLVSTLIIRLILPNQSRVLFLLSRSLTSTKFLLLRATVYVYMFSQSSWVDP